MNRPINKGDEYTCALCGGVYEAEWDDSEAMAECQEVFGVVHDEPVEVVCDDCWQKIRPDRN